VELEQANAAPAHCPAPEVRQAAIAEWRATGNDERNARLVAAGSLRSTLVIEHTPATVSAPGRE
jgi:hypothetical protein